METARLPISVIIPTLNRPESLQRTVKTLFRQPWRPEEVLVIDQSREEATRQQNQQLLARFPECRYLYLAQPSSTAARNVGIREATRDVLVFMDDDIDVNEHSLKNISDRMADPKIALIAVLNEAKLHGGSGRIGYLFGLKSWRNRHQGHVTLSMLGRYPDRTVGEVPTMWAMGYCFAARKQLLDKWNILFDEKLTGYAYGEDLDLTYAYCKQAKKEGYLCILSQAISVRHLGTLEYRIPQKRNIYKYVINRTYLGYKHHTGWLGQLAIRWSNVGYFLAMARAKTHPGAVIAAQLRCDRIRSRLKNGDIRDEDTII